MQTIGVCLHLTLAGIFASSSYYQFCFAIVYVFEFVEIIYFLFYWIDEGVGGLFYL